MNDDDKVVYVAAPRPKPMTVGHMIAELSKHDKSMEVWVDTEARCDQYHMYPTDGVWEAPDIGHGKTVYISLSI
jgi:hypothetical protein